MLAQIGGIVTPKRQPRSTKAAAKIKTEAIMSLFTMMRTTISRKQTIGKALPYQTREWRWRRLRRVLGRRQQTSRDRGVSNEVTTMKIGAKLHVDLSSFGDNDFLRAGGEFVSGVSVAVTVAGVSLVSMAYPQHPPGGHHGGALLRLISFSAFLLSFSQSAFLLEVIVSSKYSDNRSQFCHLPAFFSLIFLTKLTTNRHTCLRLPLILDFPFLRFLYLLTRFRLSRSTWLRCPSPLRSWPSSRSTRLWSSSSGVWRSSWSTWLRCPSSWLRCSWLWSSSSSSSSYVSFFFSILVYSTIY